MGHKSGFLSGPEPEEIEEKTAAEINDAKRPEAMSVSSSMFDLAETDDRPAIEQQANKGVLFRDNESEEKSAKGQSTGGGNALKVDADFAAEMHARDAKEKAEREKRREEAEKAAKTKKAEREQKIAERLKGTQTLDEDDLKDQLKEEIAAENREQLYPDAKPITADVETELWKERTDQGKQIAERAKIVDVHNTNLDRAIKISIVLSVIGSILAALAAISNLKNSIAVTFYVASVVIIAAAFILLLAEANRAKKHQISSDQHTQFMLATLIPGVTMRVLIIALVAQIPMTGGFVCAVAGAAVGGSIHYAILNRFGIAVSVKDTLINTALYFVVLCFQYLPSIDSPGAFSSGNESFQIIWLCLYLVEYFLGDQAAMRLALFSNK